MAPQHQRFLITLMDHHSGWVEYMLTGETTTPTVIRWLKFLFARYGLPNTLLSDNGRNFTATDFFHFLAKNGVKHDRSPVYHPEGNGQLEVFHRLVKQGVETFQPGGKWDEKLATLVAQYRLSQRADGRESPAKLFLGWQPRRDFQPAGLPNQSTKATEEQPEEKKTDELRDDRHLRARGPYRLGDEVLAKKPPHPVSCRKDRRRGPSRSKSSESWASSPTASPTATSGTLDSCAASYADKNTSRLPDLSADLHATDDSEWSSRLLAEGVLMEREAAHQ